MFNLQNFNTRKHKKYKNLAYIFDWFKRVWWVIKSKNWGYLAVKNFKRISFKTKMWAISYLISWYKRKKSLTKIK